MSENNQEAVVSISADKGGGDEGDDVEHDPQYEPIISLPEVEVPTLEEDETELLNLRAKLYRYDTNENPPEWKERGTGTVKILHHLSNGTVRVVMRRDKTLKLCANHFVLPYMELKPSVSCERAWVYSVKADYADEKPRSELLAIKFGNVDNAHKWKDVFDDSKKLVKTDDTSKLDDTFEDKKFGPDNTPKLNDTFEDEKKNSSLDNENEDSDEKDDDDDDEEEDGGKDASDKEDKDKEEKENKKNTPIKQSSSEVTDKLSSLKIEETKSAQSS